jgi:hypothetical protein
MEILSKIYFEFGLKMRTTCFSRKYKKNNVEPDSASLVSRDSGSGRMANFGRDGPQVSPPGKNGHGIATRHVTTVFVSL